MPLAFYSRAANEEFWSEHWGGQDVDRLVHIASTSPLTVLLEDALPATGRILEAGCGLGQYVILLRQRSHVVIGADWSLDALQRSRKTVASSPLAVMDLSRLAVRSGTFGAYISLGVVEHDRNGPDPIVAEAARVLSPGGRLLLSVPYWNGARRLLTRRLVREGDEIRAAGGEFYQFAFTRQEVRAFVEAHGFKVLAFHPYDPARMWRKRFKRLAAELGGAGDGNAAAVAGQSPRSRSTSTRRLTRATLRRILYTDVLLRLFGHMILVIAAKT